jgi:cytochrome c oxidase subunit 2
MWFQTSQPGVYLGQCAEYCGTQHAKMLIRVIAEPIDKFEQWLANEQKPAADIAAVQKGKDAFLAQSCINCHVIRFEGSPAKGKFGPDLTHLMSRASLASGIMQNTPQTLHDWVADPQKLKPGCLMPAFSLNEDDRAAIVRYLATLE